MAAQPIPNEYRDLFEKRAFANVATLMPDGSPQVTPMWVDYDGTYVLVNTARGRQKDRNLRRDPRVALTIMDPDNPYRYLLIRGRVAEITEQGAVEHIDALAKKYTGADKYQNLRPGEVREIIKIQPEQVTGWG